MTRSIHCLVALVAAEEQRQGDVLLRGERRDQVVGLEDEADRGAAQLGELLVVELGEVDVADVHRPAGEVVEPGEAVHQRALARAGRAHDRGELARLERHGDAVEGAHLAVAAAVDLHRVHRACRSGHRASAQSCAPVVVRADGGRIRIGGDGGPPHGGAAHASVARAGRRPGRIRRPRRRPAPGRAGRAW